MKVTHPMNLLFISELLLHTCLVMWHVLSCSLYWSYVNALIATNHKEKQVIALVFFFFLVFFSFVVVVCYWVVVVLLLFFLGGFVELFFVCLFMSCLEVFWGF